MINYLRFQLRILFLRLDMDKNFKVSFVLYFVITIFVYKTYKKRTKQSRRELNARKVKRKKRKRDTRTGMFLSTEKRFHPTQNSKRVYRVEEINEKNKWRGTRGRKRFYLWKKRTIPSDGEF